jgi:hypothetical protein
VLFSLWFSGMALVDARVDSHVDRQASKRSLVRQTHTHNQAAPNSRKSL